MKKRFISLILSLCMVFTFVPLQAYAASGTTSSGKLVISDKTYEIAPDIIEREYITNNSSLSAQQMGHVMEAKIGDNAQIIVGYNDYNIEAIKSGKNWGMRKTTEQAQRAETVRNVNVVGAVNGDFFDMSNGKPLGALIMNDVVVQKGNRPCFYVDKDNVPHISDTAENIPSEAKEAIGGAYILVRDGHIAEISDTTTNPRTAVGIKADGTVVLYMVDGRQAPLSVGMTGLELAQTMLDLGCVQAMNLDGGGSSTFASQRAGDIVENNNQTAGLTLRCSPSDGYERTVSSSLMIISTAESDKQFDHAVLLPNQEVYTPGSQVQFTAQGADKSGAAVPLPDSGLTWEITGDNSIGTINSENGMFSGAEGQTGTANIVLKCNGKVVGQTSIEMQWPDKLEFTNSSVSLDFGEENDLSFSPSWHGRKVVYKDGDFEWSVDDNSELAYKRSVPVEIYTKPGWGGYDKQLILSLTGKVGEIVKSTAYHGNYLVYETSYEETDRNIQVDFSGKINVEETLTHKGAIIYSYIDGALLKNDVSADLDETVNGVTCKVTGIKTTQTVNFSLGKLENNMFVADDDTSFSGRIRVNLKNDTSVSGTIDVVVGMEPYVLMDFEDGHEDPITGNILPAEKYWTVHVGNSDDNGGNSLSLNERRQYRLMMRDTTGKGIVWPKNDDGSEKNQLVSAEDNSDVRFGSYAMQLAWDFRNIDTAQVGAADFGFSSMIYTHVVQPTKIGFWVNVPKELAEDTSQIKMIFVGGITEIADTSSTEAENKENAYYDMDADGKLTWHEHKLPKGTTQYLNYYSHDAEGNVNGSELKDWAGKGWTWIEADLSGARFPIGIQYGYTVRIVSPQNHKKQAGTILIDNLQLIYGTNTNDINNPVISSVVERNSGIDLKSSDKATITSTQPIFDIPMNDSKATDKYASGIDTGSVKLKIDGFNCTDKAEITQNPTGDTTVLLKSGQLTNGEHSLEIRVKDTSGNETTETYSFIIESPEAVNAAVKVMAQEGSPVIGNHFKLEIQNQSESEAEYVASADVAIEIGTAYGDAVNMNLSSHITYGKGYEAAAAPEYADGRVFIHVKQVPQNAEQTVNYAKTICTLHLPVPEDARKGDTLNYSVPSGYYVLNTVGMTFSQAEEKIPLTAAYNLSAGQAIVGYPVTFTVTDENDETVENDVTLYGSDNIEIDNPYTFKTAGRKTVYAKDSEGRRSWNYDVVVSALGTDENGNPFGIQNNASKIGATSKTVTWLSSIRESMDAAFIRVADSQEGLGNAENQEGSSQLMTFTQTDSGEAYRFNEVKLTNLKPESTYWYQVGDGETWSDALKFSTSASEMDAKTNFFIFADIQTNDTANLTAAISNIANGQKQYNFGIQTGDAIDNVTNFNNWRSYLTTLNSQKLGGIDVIHALGNHEYYGDAEGKTAGAIFSLQECSAGSYYSTEYGSVYVGVVNDGGDIFNALAEAKDDAAKSNCAWKVLVFHQPVYGTESIMTDSRRLDVVKAIEDAGFDVVFSGDDHAYARTYPMKEDTALAENSREGVVYYVCGDLSGKDNEYHEHEYFAATIPHSEYSGMYLSVEADGQKMILNAYKYDGSLLDSYTIQKTDCEVGNHTFDETSLYNLENKTLNCTVCGVDVPAKDSGYTGRLKTSGNEGEVVLVVGTVKTGWFTLGEDILHAGDDGLLHKSQTVDTATCLENGYLKSVCECSEVYQGNATWAKGHTWDENHVCTVCGTKGISLDEVKFTLSGSSWTYRGTAIKPGLTATYGDYTLSISSDRRGTDGYKSYSNNINPGMGTITVEGRGDFYGAKSINFPILPAQVENVAAGEILSAATSIQWDAAGGAQYYKVFKKSAGSSWELVGTTTGTGIIIKGLEPDTEYSFRVKGSADSDGKTFDSFSYSDVLTITTEPSDGTKTADSVERLNVNLVVNEKTVSIPMVEKDGEYYLLLPSSADLSRLELATVIAGEEEVKCIGSIGMQTINTTGGIIDITTLTGNNGGMNDIMLSVGSSEPMTIHVVKSSRIPTMYLTSDDSVTQGRDYVDASKNNETTAYMTMVSADGDVVYSGSLKQLKSRGNSTFAYYDKKPYQIKLSSASDLLGNGENVKTWVLLAGYADATQIRDKLFKDLATEMGMPYTASCDWVDLYYDGEYRGTYLLSEKNAVNSTSVNIRDMEGAYKELNSGYGKDMETATGSNAFGQEFLYTIGLTEPKNLTGGYLIERNLNNIDEASGFYTKQGGGFNVKSPEFAGLEAMKYISEYYQEFEDAVFAQDGEGNYTGYNAETGKYYYEYCDIDSLVKTFLIQELSLNGDGFLKSFYFYKDQDSIMYAGPVWDMDMTCGSSWSRINGPESSGYYYLADALRKIPGFMERVDQYYDDVFSSLANGLIGENGKIAEYAGKVSASAEMNSFLWPYVRMGSPAETEHLWPAGTTYTDVVEKLTSWLSKRLAKLDVMYGDGTLHIEHTYISTVTKEPTYTEEGIRTFTCTICHDTYTEVIPKLTMPSGGGGGAIVPIVPPVEQDSYKKDAIENIASRAEENKYEAEEQNVINQILADAKKKIEAAKSEEEVAAIEQEAKKAIEAIDTAEEKQLIQMIKSIDKDSFRAKSKILSLNKKIAVMVTWNAPANVEFDGFDVFRSTKKLSGFGKKPFFTTKNNSYTNNKGLKAGNTYYYKVRAFKIVNGRKVYTNWSTKAWRTIK